MSWQVPASTRDSRLRRKRTIDVERPVLRGLPLAPLRFQARGYCPATRTPATSSAHDLKHSGLSCPAARTLGSPWEEMLKAQK